MVIWGQCTQDFERQPKELSVHSRGHEELGEGLDQGRRDDEHCACGRMIVDCDEEVGGS